MFSVNIIKGTIPGLLLSWLVWPFLGYFWFFLHDEYYSSLCLYLYEDFCLWLYYHLLILLDFFQSDIWKADCQWSWTSHMFICLSLRWYLLPFFHWTIFIFPTYRSFFFYIKNINPFTHHMLQAFSPMYTHICYLYGFVIKIHIFHIAFKLFVYLLPVW